MDTIILLETSTELCSAAIARDGEIISYRESGTPRAHASLTAVFVQEMLDETGVRLGDCSAVCVSMGPGSYTGLRVGVSTAKGLCFGAGIPLLAVKKMSGRPYWSLAVSAASQAQDRCSSSETGPGRHLK